MLSYLRLKMNPPLKKPCRECPFRRRSIPGYLGNSTPAEFLASTMADQPMPCHLTVDYEDRNWKDMLDEASHCNGALTFFSNICKLSNDPNRPKMPVDCENVFTRPTEFLDHHGGTLEEFQDIMYGSITKVE